MIRHTSELCDVPGRDTAPGFLLRRSLLQRTGPRSVDCCVYATWVRFPKMTGGLAKAHAIDGKAEKACRYNGLVASCGASRRARSGEPSSGRPLGAVLMSPVSRRFVLTG